MRFPTKAEFLQQVLDRNLAQYNALTSDEKQLILDCINSGFTIGQAREWTGASLEAVMETINRNLIVGPLGLRTMEVSSE